MTFQSFDFECIWWRLFQKRAVRTKFIIYVFITYYQCYFNIKMFSICSVSLNTAVNIMTVSRNPTCKLFTIPSRKIIRWYIGNGWGHDRIVITTNETYGSYLWHRFSVTVNQFMVAIVKRSDDFNNIHGSVVFLLTATLCQGNLKYFSIRVTKT